MRGQTRLRIIILVSVMLGAAVGSHAATYWVAATGGTTAGSCAAATGTSDPSVYLRTIQGGLNCTTAAGDIVNVKAGTYTEIVSYSGHSNDGASGNPKILRANPGDTVTWTAPAVTACSLSNPPLFMQDISHITIQGFRFSGAATGSTIRLLQTADQVNKTTPMEGISIINNTFVNNGHNGYGGTINFCPGTTSGCMSRQIYAQYLGRGPGYSGAPVNLISGNTFTDNFGANIDFDNTSDTRVHANTSTGNRGSRNDSNGCLYQMNMIQGGGYGTTRNIVEDNNISNMFGEVTPTGDGFEGVGIRFDVGVNNTMVQRNIVHDIGSEATWTNIRHFHGLFNENDCNYNTFQNNIVYKVNETCMFVGTTTTTRSLDVNVYNNTFHDCGQVGVLLGHAQGTEIKNNIVFGTSRSQVNVTPESVALGGNVFQNNLWYRGGSAFGCWSWSPGTQGYCTGQLNLSQWATSSGETGALSTDPLIAATTTADFRLCRASGVPVAGCTGASPAINTGINIGLPFNGPSPDMGALETGGEGLVGNWAFDDGSGTVASDLTAGNHDGSLCEGATCGQQGPVWDAGQIQGTLIFDGTSDRVEVPYHTDFNITGNLSITAWVKRGSTGTVDAVLAKTNRTSLWDYELSLCDATVCTAPNANKLRFEGAGATVYSTGTVTNDDQWHHVAFVRGEPSATSYKFYLDGGLSGSGTLSGSFATNAIPIQLGNDSSTGGWFHGSIDELRLYNTALTQAEILALTEVGDRPEQIVWRWRLPDELEAGKWQRGQNLSGRIVRGNRARLRVGLANTEGSAPPQLYKLYCRSPAGTGATYDWFEVTESCASNPLCYSLDPAVSHLALLTPQLSIPGYTFVSGGAFLEDTGGSQATYTLGALTYAEREHSLQVSSSIAVDTTFGCCERLGNGVQLNSCTEATLNVVGPHGRVSAE